MATNPTTVDVQVNKDAGTRPGPPPAGIVDENGVLWKASKVGSFTDRLPGDEGVDNVYSALESRVKKTPERFAVAKRDVVSIDYEAKFEKLTLGPYKYTKFSEYHERVCSVGSGLWKLAGEHLASKPYVVIYAQTQLEWMLSAYATWRQGGTVVTIYDTLGADGAEFGLNQTQATTVVADAKLLKVLATVASKCPALKHVITLTDAIDAEQRQALEAAGVKVTPLSEVEKMGSDAKAAAAPAGREATAVLMYTSGTTGSPKGVELTHGNVLAIMASTFSADSAILAWPQRFKLDLADNPTYLAYLPLAHIMELAVETTLLYLGVTLCYGSPHTLTATSIKMKQTKPPQEGDAAAAKPTIMVFAPAVLDKVYAKVNSMFAAKGCLVKMLIARGFRKGFANYDKGGCGSTGFPEGLIFSKVQKLLGGRVQIALTGSAPLAADVQKWVQTVFNAPCRQGYGLTETTAATCITLASDNRTSVVGPPQECSCIRLRDWPEGKYFNDDLSAPTIKMRRGEILIGGPGVCKGYFVNPDDPDPDIVEKNATEFVTLDGVRYFCTGDIGQFTPEGNVQIIDRKKDLVKLQQGEYVALSKVENVLKTSKYVELPMAYAVSTESSCIALVCPMAPALKALAAEMNVTGTLEELCANPALVEKVLADLQTCCKGKLVPFETPQKLILVADVWTVENDMLTAAMKLKRKPIVERHAEQIAAIGYGTAPAK